MMSSLFGFNLFDLLSLNRPVKALFSAKIHPSTYKQGEKYHHFQLTVTDWTLEA